jgi:hypothetical protein
MIASPMKAALSVNAGVEKTSMTYSRAGIPSTKESKLFQRTVKNFSFVILLPLYPDRFPDHAATIATSIFHKDSYMPFCSLLQPSGEPLQRDNEQLPSLYVTVKVMGPTLHYTLTGVLGQVRLALSSMSSRHCFWGR